MVDGGTSRWPDATPGVGRSIGWSKNCSKNWTKESSLLPLDSVCNAEGVLMASVSCYVFSSLERKCGQEQKHRRGARDRDETEHLSTYQASRRNVSRKSHFYPPVFFNCGIRLAFQILSHVDRISRFPCRKANASVGVGFADIISLAEWRQHPNLTYRVRLICVACFVLDSSSGLSGIS